MSKLTPKQEKFCQLYIELGNASEAYRQSYDVGVNTKLETVNVKASELLADGKISVRVNELKEQTAKKHEIDRDYILKHYKGMIETFAEVKALMNKEKLTDADKAKIYALSNSGLIRGSDVTSSLSNMAKMLGLNEPEEEKKRIDVNINIRRGRDIED